MGVAYCGVFSNERAGSEGVSGNFSFVNAGSRRLKMNWSDGGKDRERSYEDSDKTKGICSCVVADRFISVGDPYKELRRLPGRWKGKQFQTEGW